LPPRNSEYSIYVVSRPSFFEFVAVLRRSFVAAMGGGVAVVATLVAAFAPKLASPLFVGASALICGVLSAYVIWSNERNERIRLEETNAARPFVTVEYSQNATEDEPNLYDTLCFENIGHDAAVSIDVSTNPPAFGSKQIRPHLVWGVVTKIKPGDKDEKSVEGFHSYLQEIRGAVTRREGKAADVVVPLVVSYSDTRGRRWSETHALRYNGYGVWVENVTNRDVVWTII
jgi:hypothetical protein